MKVTQVASARYHHMDLARQLSSRGLLEVAWTGYPRVKLRDEPGIPSSLLRTSPTVYTPANLLANRTPIRHFDSARQTLGLTGKMAVDARVARSISSPTLLYALSSHGLASGQRAQRMGGVHICDRGSTHIRHQSDVLRLEADRWGLTVRPVIPATVRREEAEYSSADRIVVPSEYVRSTFLQRGFSPDKVVKIPYGADYTRFRPVAEPSPSSFEILFVGQVSLRKGFVYLLKAFERISAKRKRLRVAGAVQPEMKALLRCVSTDSVEFLGPVPRSELARLYSSSHALALPSLEEGLALVMGEAMSSGCPVVATSATGAADLFAHGNGGLHVPERDVDALYTSLERVREEYADFRQSALSIASDLGGWDSYGDRVESLVRSLGVGS